MPNAAYIARRVAKVVASHGEPMTLKRAGETDLPVIGKRQSGSTDDIGGTALQQTFRVIIAPTELGASSWAVKAPKRTDVIVIGGQARVVRDVQPQGDGDVVAMYVLEVAG